MIFFLVFNNAEILFKIETFEWKTYNSAEALLITRHMQPINGHKLDELAYDKNSGKFNMHISVMMSQDPTIHSTCFLLLATLE